jgi:folate-binding protein YgfZ
LLGDCGLPAPAGRLEHAAASIGGNDVWVRRVDLTGPDGFLIAFRRESLDTVATALIMAGAIRCGMDVFETCRIEYGTPLYGRDISEENLPQEVDRDALAINFTKGCYLGQETVARIDALGHVNRLLRGVKFAAKAVPAVGTEVLGGGKSVGSVTSACWSPRLNCPLGLAYLRRGSHEAGTKLEATAGVAEVIALPIS